MTDKNIALKDAQTVHMIPPSMDVLENENEYLLIADVPGASAQDVQIELHNGELTLRAAVQGSGVDLFSGGRTGYEYARRFHIPSGIDTEKVAAKMNNGVLELRIPKAAEKKPRQIPVTVS
jgi:HSP20 family protein